jgi:hypothetical protein
MIDAEENKKRLAEIKERLLEAIDERVTPSEAEDDKNAFEEFEHFEDALKKALFDIEAEKQARLREAGKK